MEILYPIETRKQVFSHLKKLQIFCGKMEKKNEKGKGGIILIGTS
jgi:hypothetical protein